VKRLLPVALIALAVALAAGPSAAAAAEPFAEGCPSTALEEGSVTKLNHNPAAKKALVPAGATSLRICRYYGSGEAGKQTPKTQARAGDLENQRVVGGRDLLESVTLEFNELETVPKGFIGCPFDDGADLYAVFSYPGGRPVFIEVSLSGCEFALGAVPWAHFMSPALKSQLIRLVDGKKVHPGRGTAK
jgi:hypothetical protein